MCQLTLLNFHEDFDLNDPEIKKQFYDLMYFISVVNAREHPDGHGLYVFDSKSGKDIIIKTKENGILGTVVEELEKKKLTLSSPILFHVRKASAVYKKETLLDENAHPFEGENFILAHNGTFSGEHVTAEKDNSFIDSRIFHRELEKNWKEKDKKDSFTKVLQKTIDDFSGKMALMIRKKDTKEFFVLRNSRADLHKTSIKYKGEVVGYIINTEEAPMYSINNLAYRFTDFTFDFLKSPENIKDMVLFKVGDKDLVKVDDIKYTAATTTYYGAKDYPKTRTKHTSNVNSGTSGVDVSWLIKDFIPATKLSLAEVNLLFSVYGFPIPYIKTGKEYRKAENKVKKLFNEHYRKEKRKIIEELFDFGVTLQDFHESYAFPYFILTEQELKKIKKEVIHG